MKVEAMSLGKKGYTLVELIVVLVLIGLVLSSSGLLAVPAAALYHFAGEVFVLDEQRVAGRFEDLLLELVEPGKQVPWFEAHASLNLPKPANRLWRRSMSSTEEF